MPRSSPLIAARWSPPPRGARLEQLLAIALRRSRPRGARRQHLAFALVLLLAGALAGCEGLAEERCEARCECTGCPEQEAEECVVEAAAEEDTAEAYACGELYEAYVSCELTRSLCRDGRFFLDGLDCNAERAALSECKVRASTLD